MGSLRRDDPDGSHHPSKTQHRDGCEDPLLGRLGVLHQPLKSDVCKESDTNAAFKLPEDAGRVQFLYLGDLSEARADKFLDKYKLKDSMSPELRKKLYEVCSFQSLFFDSLTH